MPVILILPLDWGRGSPKKKLTTTAKLLTRENQKLLTRLEQAEKKIKSQNQEIKIWKKKYQDSVDRVRELPLEKVVYEARFDTSPPKINTRGVRNIT